MNTTSKDSKKVNMGSLLESQSHNTPNFESMMVQSKLSTDIFELPKNFPKLQLANQEHCVDCQFEVPLEVEDHRPACA